MFSLENTDTDLQLLWKDIPFDESWSLLSSVMNDNESMTRIIAHINIEEFVETNK